MTKKKTGKEAQETQQRAGVIPVELFSYVLSPERLEKLKRYAVMYLMKYGLEEEETAAEKLDGEHR
jgi:hypothetical protein